MKKLFLLFAVSGLFFASCVNNPAGEKATTTEAQQAPADASGQAFTINPQESMLRWEGKKVSATHHGTVQFKSGKVMFNGDQLTGGEFVADMSTIVNEDLKGEWNTKLVNHLKNEDFFNVGQHPEATFTITEVKPGDTPNQMSVSGNLTIRGVSKNVTFKADMVKTADKKVEMKADFNIAREDWGITYTGMADDLISKEINFKVSIVAYS